MKEVDNGSKELRTSDVSTRVWQVHGGLCLYMTMLDRSAVNSYIDPAKKYLDDHSKFF